jgi:hypothetical protein
VTVITKHPLYRLLKEHAYFRSVPSDHELEQLGLPEDTRRQARAAATEAAKLHATGYQQDAWQHAAEAALQLRLGFATPGGGLLVDRLQRGERHLTPRVGVAPLAQALGHLLAVDQPTQDMGRRPSNERPADERRPRHVPRSR